MYNVNDELVNPEFKELKDNLKSDIDNIDARLIDISKNSNLLQSNIDRMSNIILNTNTQQNQNLGKFYAIQTDLLKTLTGYNDNYEKLLNLKFKYRSQQNDLTLKIVRFYQLELKKLENDIQEEDVNYKSVLNSIAKLTTNSDDNQPVTNFDLEFEDDEKI